MRREFQELVETEAWAQLVKVAKVQRETRVTTVLNTHTTPENIAHINFIRGEAAAIQLFTELPDIIIKQAEQDLERSSGMPIDED